MSSKNNLFKRKWILISLFVIIAFLLVSVNNGYFIRGEEKDNENEEKETETVKELNVDITPIEEIANANTSPKSGNPAINFSFKDNEDKLHQLSDFQDEKAVLLNFWTTWCPTCGKEMPLIQKVYEDYKNEVQVLSINIQEQKNTIQTFKENNEYTFPVLQDNGMLSQQYQIQSIPTIIIIDKNGVITGKHIGLMTFDELKSKLDTAINVSEDDN
ncbi:MAG: TlpA family protein disulfide reductase [bacterium]